MIKSFAKEIFDVADTSADILFPFYPFVPSWPTEELAKLDHADSDYEEKFYKVVGAARAKNKKFRDAITEIAERDENERKLILAACRRDLLFFINTFLYIKQERPEPVDHLFLTWPKQNEYVALLAHTQKIVRADKTGKVKGNIRAEKPREVGWTWLNSAEVLQAVRFVKDSTCLIGSRVAYDVDASGGGDADKMPTETLFGKLDYYIEKLPKWFMPEDYWKEPGVASKKSRTSMRLNVSGGGKIKGSPTHKSFGRSGRFFIVDLDEFAHVDQDRPGTSDHIWACTSSTCSLRRATSTPAGHNNKFAKLKGNPDLFQFVVHWYDDPYKMIGAYKLTEPKTVGPVVLQVGEWWGPWPEAARREMDNDALFAQEILLSYEGLGGNYYEEPTMKIVRKTVMFPAMQGRLEILGGDKRPDGSVNQPRVMRFLPDSQGPMSLWFNLDPAGFPDRKSMYGLGVDIASGVRDDEGRGASNSSIEVGDLITGRKVAEYITHRTLPHQLAAVAVAIAHWFQGMDGQPAKMLWEANGLGGPFGAVVTEELGFSHVWYPTRIGRSKEQFLKPGFFKSGGEKGSAIELFEQHVKAITSGRYTERSSQTVAEMEKYIRQPDGSAVFAGSLSTLDPNEAKANHGDCVIATCLLVKLMYEFGDSVDEEPIKRPPHTSVAAEEERMMLAGMNDF